MYDIDSVLIAAVLLLLMALAIELGFRLGLRRKDSANEATKAQINSTQSSILGILALLLAFTFSLSLQRFNTRSDAAVDEANAIGTAYLRSQLLPVSLRQEARSLLESYLDVRVQAGALSMVQQKDWLPLQAKAASLQAALWVQARKAAEIDPNPVTSGLFIDALNNLIDSFSKRDAAIKRHVPEAALFLLHGTLLIAGLIVGITCGVSGQRPSLVNFAMVALMVALVFVILDLDRPRRGLITVSDESLVDLQTSLKKPQPTGAI